MLIISRDMLSLLRDKEKRHKFPNSPENFRKQLYHLMKCFTKAFAMKKQTLMAADTLLMPSSCV